MKKFLLILAGVSSLSLFSSYSQAADKILSPVSGWHVEKLKAVGSKSACLVYAQYEDGVSLSLEALQSQLSALRLSVASGSFELGQTYDVTVHIAPNYREVKTAQTASSDELVIDGSHDQALLKAIQQGFIVNIAVGEMSYGLSLSGATEGVRRLLTCRETNWRAARRVYDSVNSHTTASADQAGTSDPSLPIQINAYPLESGNATVSAPARVAGEAVSEPLAVPPKEMTLAQNEDVVNLPVTHNDSGPETSQLAASYIVGRETTELSEQRGGVVDLSNPDEQEVVVEPVNSVTRIHTPKVKIQPRNANQAVDIAVPVRGNDDLAKPPAFDESLINEGQAMAHSGADIPDMPVPGRNPDAVLSSADETVTRLARKSDTDYEIFVEDSPVQRRNERAVLSQSSDGIYTKPVVIPRIPEADLPRRIDLTNPDHSDGAEDGTQYGYASRTVSNEELERELKSREAAGAGYGMREPVMATPAPATSLEMAASIRWNAEQGDNLREILAKWSIEEGVELIWDSEQQYALLSSVRMNASYEKAVAHVLNQYMAAQGLDNRPVGQLYVDPQSGSKVLIIQTDHG